MTHALTTALLLAGLVLPATSAETQPDSFSHQAPGYFFTAGRSYLGVDIKDVTSDRVSALKLKEEKGVEITMVDQDAPAGKAGLREHDVILDFNGTAVESEEQLRRMIREVPAGRTVTLGISRDGAPMKISVQLADHSKVVAQNAPHVIIPAVPQVEWRNSMDIPVMPLQMYSSALGVQTENLTRQLGEFFGVKDGEGVLVRSVEKGSAGEKAGLKAGDVIVKADNEKLTDRTDLTHILRNHRTGGKVTLVVMRDKHEQTFTVTLPDRSSRDSSYLDLDTEDLQASLGSIPEVFSNLSDDVQVLSLDDLSSLGDSLAILNNGKALLDLQNLPAVKDSLKQTQRELQHMQKQLQELHISSDPI